MLELSTNNFAFGQIRINNPVSVTVQLINNTDKDIEISSIKRGCGSCTQAFMENGVTKVKAHSKEPLKVVFTPNSTGINRKSVTINGSLIFSFNAVVY